MKSRDGQNVRQSGCGKLCADAAVQCCLTASQQCGYDGGGARIGQAFFDAECNQSAGEGDAVGEPARAMVNAYPEGMLHERGDTKRAGELPLVEIVWVSWGMGQAHAATDHDIIANVDGQGARQGRGYLNACARLTHSETVIAGGGDGSIEEICGEGRRTLYV